MLLPIPAVIAFSHESPIYLPAATVAATTEAFFS